MSMITASDLRPGVLIQRKGQLLRVVKCEHIRVGGRGGAYIQVELKGVPNGSKLNERLHTDEKFERPFVDARSMLFMYSENDSFFFMDQESYEQIELEREIVADAEPYLLPETIVRVLMLEGSAMSIELPASVALTVAETEPRIKGATAASNSKPAKTDTGLSVMVPAFVEQGEKILVSTATGEYLERVSA